MGRGSLPALPGGWKSIAGVLGLALVTVVGVGLWQSGLRGESLRRWAAAHPALVAIGGITLGALALRVLGISDNLPYINHPDEPAVADRALKMIQTGDFNPHYFVYPSLYYYMQAVVYVVRFFALVSTGQIVRLDQIVPTDFYLWGRLMSALLGALTVALTYVAGRRLYGVAVGLVAAAFLAGNSSHILNSQFVTTDVAAGFFTALAFVAILRLLPPNVGEGRSHLADAEKDGWERWRLASVGWYLAAGAAIGLAISSKYNSAPVMLPFLLAHAYAVSALGSGAWLKHFFGWRLWAGLGAIVATFFLTTPFALLDMPTFLNDVASVVGHYRTGHIGHESDYNWRFYIEWFLQRDFLPTVLTIAGVALAFIRHRKADLLLLLFPVVFYLSISAYRVNFEHNLMPILPMTSILGALALVEAVRWLVGWLTRDGRLADEKRLRTAGIVGLALLAVLAIAPATWAAAQRGYRQTQPDNRLRASQWLDANTRPGTKVWLEPLRPNLTPGRYLTGYGDHVVDKPLEWYVANRYEYLVLSAGAYKDVVYDNPGKNPPLRDAYLRFFDENKSRLAAAFEMNEIDHPGPTILIYRTPYTPPRSTADVMPQHPFSATFQETEQGGVVELIGADYPLTATAGSALPLILYWHPKTPLRENYTVFVHLVDESGERPTQRDTAPRSGTYPTSLWQPGEVVLDEADVGLPDNLPPGRYTLRVGLYLQAADQFRTPFTMSGGPPGSTQDYVQLGPLTIQGPQN
jgi:4-amino-4-deoxy-L-arabinose transferase-like glycosyltransferase